MKKKWLSVALIGSILSIPVLIKLTRTENYKEVETEKISFREIKSSVLASGNLIYEEQVALSPEVIGKVSAILVKEGDHVERDETVLYLNDQSYKAEIAQREADVRQQYLNIERKKLSLVNQERQYRRAENLFKVKFISSAQMEDAKNALDLAKIELKDSQEGLNQSQAILKQSVERAGKTKIRAPISGIVTAIDIKLGETALGGTTGIAGSNLMSIANTDTIVTEVNIDEADIANIKVGQEAAIFTSAYPDIALKGRVKMIPLSSKKQEPLQRDTAVSARKYSVKVSLENPLGLQLRPGMTCRTEIYTASHKNTLAVPIQAILSNNDETTEIASNSGDKKIFEKIENFVFVNEAGRAVKKIVKTGISDDSIQEITAGLKNGDEAIVGPYRLLRHLKSGDPVRQTGAAQ